MTTRERISDIALAALVVFSIGAAFLAAANAFQVAAHIGTATICLAILVAMALVRKNPRVWAPRVATNSAQYVVYALAAVVVVLYFIGIVATPIPG
ncbi:hypothetical protein [Paenarthrobacter sp. NPDC090522]|uniref:hypothetical protein n=1 Tax=Paenarthrobacter sp. NPDC090522 TaxID=3364383 RepID=UPI003825DA55